LRGIVGVVGYLLHGIIKQKPEKASDNNIHTKSQLIGENVPFPGTEWAVFVRG
jgi:hypothetical protein